MRVGLPVDIPKFDTHGVEASLIQKLGGLDEKTRDRVLEAFRPAKNK
jgi:hypothetical protein